MSAAALLPLAMGAAFDRLPLAIRAMHGEAAARVAIGRADVTRGRGWLARLAAMLLRLPRDGRDQPMTVWFTPLPRFPVQWTGKSLPRVGLASGFTRSGVSTRPRSALSGRERWTREIGASDFASVLEVRDGLLFERVHGLTVAMRAAPIDGGQFDGGLSLELVRAWFCGVPLPRLMSPRFVGRMRAPECLYRFEVAVAFPLIGELIRYAGWLAPPGPVGARR